LFNCSFKKNKKGRSLLSVPFILFVADVAGYCKSFHQTLSKPQYRLFIHLVSSLLICMQAHRITEALRAFSFWCHWTNIYTFLRSPAVAEKCHALIHHIETQFILPRIGDCPYLKLNIRLPASWNIPGNFAPRTLHNKMFIRSE